mmetsp:Transcript_6992/g.12024  ORF Transcript_6992/g.12024 Transcript_6992/m.12024 type:complete len:197 (-) Transcript_6992:199-789(-)
MTAERHFFVNGRQASMKEFADTNKLVTDSSRSPGDCRPWFEDVIGQTPDGHQRRLVLFDGMCKLCLGFVRIVITRDSTDLFRFAPLQSDMGQAVLAWHGLPADLDSVVLHRDGVGLTHSSAALEILSEVDGMMKLLYGFVVLPRGLRDWGYELVAKSRYSLLGHTSVSEVGDPEIEKRLADTWEPDANSKEKICSS